MLRKIVWPVMIGIGIVALTAFILCWPTLFQTQPEDSHLTIEDGPFYLSLSGYQPEIQLGESLNLVGQLENRSDQALSILRGPSVVFVTVEKMGSPDAQTIDNVGRQDTLAAQKTTVSSTVFSPTEKGQYRISVFSNFSFLEDYPTVTENMRFYSKETRSVSLRLEDRYIEVV